jgi:glycosyltransferase involved in cell wall biosynthesis
MHILFASPHCALDRGSGAAISIKTQLEELARLGWRCRTLTGTVTSVHEPVGRHFAEWGVHRAGQAGQSLLLGTNRRGVEHLIVPMRDTRRAHITSGDEQRYFDVVREQLRNRRPDVLYIYGGRLLEQAIMREARRQGIATAFYLANASYREPFEDADAVFTPSRALAEFYGESLGLTAEAIGSFTRPLTLPPERGEAVLFVNPEPGKGASFFVEIARRCLTELPEVRFLVVESRGTKESSARQLDVDWAELPNVVFLPQQADLCAAFATSRLLLFPALCFDAAPRIIVEANHAGLPVLASAHGGSPEMLDGAGFLIEVAQRYRAALTTLPDSDAVTPWVEHLKVLWRDQEAYALACARATAAARRHDLPCLAETLSRRLAALVRTVGKNPNDACLPRSRRP